MKGLIIKTRNKKLQIYKNCTSLLYGPTTLIECLSSVSRVLVGLRFFLSCSKTLKDKSRISIWHLHSRQNHEQKNRFLSANYHIFLPFIID